MNVHTGLQVDLVGPFNFAIRTHTTVREESLEITPLHSRDCEVIVFCWNLVGHKKFITIILGAKAKSTLHLTLAVIVDNI